MNSDQDFNLLIDLDAMLDTRMGTLVGMDVNISKVLPIATYRNRTKDDWTELTGGVVTTEMFNEHYAKRDIKTLRNSVITGLIPIVITYIDSLTARFFRGVNVKSVSIDINTYPYTLPGPIAEAFKNCLRVLVPTYVSVGIGCVSPEEMTPDFLKNNYSGWVTYEFHPWLEMHQDALLVRPINEVSVIIPKLFINELGDGVDMFNDMDKHGLLEMTMEDFIHIEHIPASDFCFVIPKSHKIPEPDDLGDQPSSVGSRREASDALTDPTKSS